MPSNTIIGQIRALLTASAADFKAEMDKAANAADQFSKEMAAAGKTFTDVGGRLSAVNRLVKDFNGDLDKRRAEEYAEAVHRIGGAAKLTAEDQAKVNAVVTEALSKYQALGQEAPKHLTALAAATAKVDKPMRGFSDVMGEVKGRFTALGPEVLKSAVAFGAGLISVQALQAGFRILKDFVIDCVKAFLDAEAAERKIDAALRSSGQFTRQLAQDYRALAGEMQTLTVHSDDLNAEAIALFTTIGDVGPSQMKRALQAAADLSAGLGIGLVEASQLVARASIGKTTALSKYGIEVEKTTDRGKQLENVLVAVNAQFSGQAQAQVETSAGQIAQLGNAWNNVKEILGGIVVNSPKFQAFLQTTNALLKEEAAAADSATAAHGRYLDMRLRLGLGIPRAKNFGQDIHLGPSAPPPDFVARISDAQKQIDKLTLSQRLQLDAAKKLGDEFETLATKYGLGEDAQRLYTAATKDGTKATDTYQRELQQLADQLTGRSLTLEVKKLADALKLAGGESKLTAVEHQRLVERLKEMVSQGAKLPPELHAIWARYVSLHEILPKVGGDWKEMLALVPSVTLANRQQARSLNDILHGLQQIQAFRASIPIGKGSLLESLGISGPGLMPSLPPNAFASLGKSLISAFTGKGGFSDQLGSTILQALTGGGSVSGSIGALAGQKIGQSLSENLGGFLTQNLGKTLGGALNAILPGIGALIGPLLSKAFGKIGDFFGGLVGMNKTKGSREDFAKQLGFGNLAALYDELRKMGDEGGKLAHIGSAIIGRKDEAANRKWMEDVKKFLDDTKQKGADAAAALEQKLGGAFGLLSQAAQDFGGKAPKALRPMIDELLKAKNLTEEQLAALQGLSGDPSWQTLQSMAQQYGIELGALGQQFQQARISDLAMQYARDFMTMRDAGADVTGVLMGMKDEVQAVVTDALKFGTTVPEAMRPMLEELIRMGELTDENGNKLDDLSRFSFKGTLEDAFVGMKTILEEIRDLLAGGVKKSLTDVADTGKEKWRELAEEARTHFRLIGGEASGLAARMHKELGNLNFDVVFNANTRIPQPVIGSGLQGFQHGTHGRYVDFGAGTPVMLHGRERVMTEAEGGMMTVVLEQDGRAAARWLVPFIPGEVRRLGLTRT